MEQGMYKIGTAAEKSGLPTMTIRMWERRYQVVNPSRTESGQRLYSDHDIQRLRDLKQAVEQGHQIGRVARLSPEELDKVLAEAPAPELNIALVGRRRAHGKYAMPDNCSLVDNVSHISELPDKLDCDALIVSVTTLSDASLAPIELWRRKQDRQPVLIIEYLLATSRKLAVVDGPNVRAVRGPASLSQLIFTASALRQRPQNPREQQVETIDLLLQRPVPKQRIAPESLLAAEDAARSLKCECPKHLADLIISLGAFEQYSAECENQNPQDAALHQMLNHLSGQVRGIMEESLIRVLRADGVEVDTAQA